MDVGEEGRDGAETAASRGGRNAKRSAGGGATAGGGASAKEAAVNFLESLRQGPRSQGLWGLCRDRNTE